MDKAPDAFRTISEVAEDLNLPQHVLRFWETRFNQIRPLKRGGGRRYYRPDDVQLLRGIRHLLYGEGYTIKGVQRILKEQGARFVADVGQNPGMPIPNESADFARLMLEGPHSISDYPAYREEEGEASHDLSADSTSTGARMRGPEVLPPGILPDENPARGPLRFMDRLRGAGEPSSQALSRDDMRRLQSTLFELLECKRLLDQTR